MSAQDSGGATGGRVSARLPDFPWDHLTSVAATARAHPDGIVDLSVGTPVDPSPEVAQRTLAAAADSPGYPVTIGLEATRQAALDWMRRRLGVVDVGLDGVLPVVGSKELIGSLPLHLGIGAGDLVVHPALAYPTYEVGARLAGAEAFATDALTAVGPRTPALVFVNSPANPTGRMLPADHLRKMVDWCRERFDGTPARAWMGVVRGANHFAPVADDAGTDDVEIRGWTTRWLRARLRGDAEAAAGFDGDAWTLAVDPGWTDVTRR